MKDLEEFKDISEDDDRKVAFDKYIRRQKVVQGPNGTGSANEKQEKLREAESSDVGSDRRYSSKRRDEDVDMDGENRDRRRSKREGRDKDRSPRKEDRSRGKEEDRRSSHRDRDGSRARDRSEPERDSKVSKCS
jgi:pre-mRNA-processing factor 40